jgi:hypothetical protein
VRGKGRDGGGLGWGGIGDRESGGWGRNYQRHGLLIKFGRREKEWSGWVEIWERAGVVVIS